MDNLILGLVIGILIIVAIAVSSDPTKWGKEQEAKKAALKDDYYAKLQGDDKMQALEAGRAYYASLRPENKLTVYDEARLANDLNTMKTAKNSE